MISAFATESRIVLGQQKCFEKSNEITAIPGLLELLEIKGSIISIDAMGCQKKIATQIISKNGDYILGLKGNQSSLYDDVKTFFEDKDFTKNIASHNNTYGGHGRIEVRKCSITEDIEWLQKRHKWSGLRSIIQIESEVERNNKISTDVRYYITSLPADAKKVASSITNEG